MLNFNSPPYLPRLLFVDDDKLFGDSVKNDFDPKDIVITCVQSVTEAQKLCQKNAFDVILLDNNLPDGSGLELIPDILSLNDRAKIILITAFPSFDNAVKAIKNGVFDYLSKPIDLTELHLTIEKALRTSKLEAVEQVERYRSYQDSRQNPLIGFRQNPDFLKVVERAAEAKASVLITGETGTGKNVIAKYIHYHALNQTNPFISLNCAALPETLIESELFGVEKGAFTGANQTRKGLFELADGGTLFLDEIGEMPPALQAKFLSALEDRQIRRVGGDKARSVNVRIIAATNAEPEKAIANKTFRSDLFYRLSLIRIHLPPLRERKEDIPELCRLL
ncbi:MAG: sigma-54 dependent transcriptional regulator [Pyrinomonadaceae bacterium]|nr:sigma-54 dependent transcriptional regulator [Pyrinomonadaceae bacterium]